MPPPLSWVLLVSVVRARDAAGLSAGLSSAPLFAVSHGELFVRHPSPQEYSVLVPMAMPPSLSGGLLDSERGFVSSNFVRRMLGVAALGPPGPCGSARARSTYILRCHSRFLSIAGRAFPSLFFKIIS